MKKGYIILIIVLGVLIVAGLGLFIYSTQSKAQMAERNQNLVELPDGIDYGDLTASQLADLYKKISQKYHSQTVEDEKGKKHPLSQDLIFTKDGKPVDSGQNPNQGDGGIDPIDPNDTEDPEITWPNFDFRYSYSGSDPQVIESTKRELREAREIVEKYYPLLVEILGLPHNVESRTITIHSNHNAETVSYSYQTDEITFKNAWTYSLVTNLAGAFQGEYVNVLPETWKYGMREAAYVLAIEEYPEDKDDWWWLFLGSSFALYEEYNIRDYPIWGTNIFYETDVFQFKSYQRRALAATALLKPYRYNNQFFANLNKKIYTLDITDNSIWDDDRNLFGKVSDLFPTIEGDAPVNWYEKQHVLHQVETNPLVIVVWRVFGQDFFIAPGRAVVYSFKSHVTDNGITFVPKANRSHDIKIYDDRGGLKKEQTITTGDNSRAWSDTFKTMGLIGPSRYLARIDNRNKDAPAYFYDSEAQGEHLGDRLSGIVNNFGEGKVIAYKGQNKIEEVNINRGFFAFDEKLKEKFRGVVTLKVYDHNNNQVLEREVAKSCDTYLAILDSPVASFSPQGPGQGGASRGIGDEEISELDTSDWLTYDSGFTIKYPGDWVYQKQEVTNSTEENPIVWEVVFGRKAATNVVWIGHCGQTIKSIKQYLTNEQYPGTEIREEKKVEVDGRDAIRLKFPSVVTEYDIYLYYIYEKMNVPLIIQGPAPDNPNKPEGEAAIFQAMIETLNIPTDVPQ